MNFYTVSLNRVECVRVNADEACPGEQGIRPCREILQSGTHGKDAIGKFFDEVMVMVEDEKVRANRLALLRTLLKEFSTIADFSEIVTEGK